MSPTGRSGSSRSTSQPPDARRRQGRRGNRPCPIGSGAGDVGEPELVRGWPVEVPPKQVKRYRPRRLGALRWSPVRDSLDFQLNHDRANGVLAYRVSPAEPKLGGDPGDPVGAARLLVDLGDLLRRSDPPECGSGERSVLPGVVTAP